MRFRDVLTQAGGLAAVAGGIGCVGTVAVPTGAPKTAPTAAVAHSDPADRSGLDKLAPENRKLAEAQKTCPVSGEPLGSMGAPVKVTLNGTPAFVCCKSCVGRAESQPAETLKKVEESKAKK